MDVSERNHQRVRFVGKKFQAKKGIKPFSFQVGAHAEPKAPGPKLFCHLCLELPPLLLGLLVSGHLSGKGGIDFALLILSESASRTLPVGLEPLAPVADDDGELPPNLHPVVIAVEFAVACSGKAVPLSVVRVGWELVMA